MQPTKASALVFQAKACGLRLKRALRDLRSGRPPRGKRTSELLAAPVAGLSVTPLWTAGGAAELKLTAGKVENLRIAVRALDGIELGPGEVFSFWRHLGRPVARRGFVEGREVREGCIVPSIAGGLCQLSNALYDAALKAGMTIVERHAHSRIVPGSLAERGRDATVFWNYVDLRFANATGLRIEAELTAGDLVVTLKAPKALTLGGAPLTRGGGAPLALGPAPAAAASCETCGVHSCFRHQDFHEGGGGSVRPAEAVLVDSVSPEHAAWIQQSDAARRLLFVPIDGARRSKANYAWPRGGFETVTEAWTVALRRAFASRRLAAQGAARQRALLDFDRELADWYARRLAPEVTHLVVAQNLLLPLLDNGALGGRTFDVLMTRPPLAKLQAALDRGAAAHPESPTLADFRVPAMVVTRETKALARARRIVTPHTWIASMFPDRAVLLPWSVPAGGGAAGGDGRTVLFPGPTAGRKGAYEVRAAAKALGWRVILLGGEPEGADFWTGVDTERATDAEEALTRCDAVVTPAYVENSPRVALRALGRGVPVIASEQVGLGKLGGVVTLSALSVDAILAAWEAKPFGVRHPDPNCVCDR